MTLIKGLSKISVIFACILMIGALDAYASQSFTVRADEHVVNRSDGKAINLAAGEGIYTVTSSGTAYQGGGQEYSATFLYYPEPDGTIVLTSVPNNGSIEIYAEGGSLYAFFADEMGSTWDNSGHTTLAFEKSGYSPESFDIYADTHAVDRSEGAYITLSSGSGTYTVSSTGTAYQGNDQAYSGTFLYYPEPDGTIVMTSVPNNSSITINAEGGSIFAFFADETSSLWDNYGETVLEFASNTGSVDVSLWMPSHMFYPGDECLCLVTVDNSSGQSLTNNPLFVILDVFGEYYFAPSFNNYHDNYAISFGPGETEIQVLSSFTWPYGAGAASNVAWYAALTNQPVTTVIGNIDSWEFSWAD